MNAYTTKRDVSSEKKIVVDDMLLTKDMPTAAGSRMLAGYQSLLEAEVISKLVLAEYTICGKADVGEFAIDLVGETSCNGSLVIDGKLQNAAAQILKNKEAEAAVVLDVNGAPRRAAAQNGLVSIKPTYGTVSRFGTIPVACSGETVSIMADTAEACRSLLSVIAGHDDKDGTSLPEELCARVSADAAPATRIAILTSMQNGIDADVQNALAKARQTLSKNGIELCEVNASVISAARAAWNILMSAELCNNVSRYDGVKYGYRAAEFNGIDELYTNSRTEAFGELLKTAILFGSDTLSTENYMKVYDKALRTRRVIVEAFDKLFADYDAVLMPACSTMAYTEEAVAADKHLAFTENAYTAPASITGLPAVVVGGVQLVGKAFSESTLLAIAALLEKEGK